MDYLDKFNWRMAGSLIYISYGHFQCLEAREGGLDKEAIELPRGLSH